MHNALILSYATTSRHMSPSKVPLNSRGASNTHEYAPRNISIGSGVYAQLTRVANTQIVTLRATCILYSKGSHICQAQQYYMYRYFCGKTVGNIKFSTDFYDCLVDLPVCDIFEVPVKFRSLWRVLYVRFVHNLAYKLIL